MVNLAISSDKARLMLTESCKIATLIAPLFLSSFGGLAEELGTALQKLLRGCEALTHLQISFF